MKGLRTDWLDLIAFRSTRGIVARVPDKTDTVAPDDERFSRGTAVRLALAGAASLWFGLGRTASGSAENPPPLTPVAERCLAGCGKTYEDNLRKQLAACDRIYPTAFADTPPFSWARVKASLPFPLLQIARAALAESCYVAAQALSRQLVDRCLSNCVDECAKQAAGPRSLQGSNAACEPLPPPESKPPEVPALPSSSDNPCWACAQVGGLCCAGSDPTTLCACANPGVGCEAYGC